METHVEKVDFAIELHHPRHIQSIPFPLQEGNGMDPEFITPPHQKFFPPSYRSELLHRVSENFTHFIALLMPINKGMCNM